MSREDAPPPRREVLRQLACIIHTQFEDASLTVTESSVIEDFPDWDSIAHVQIMVAVEGYFRIRFEAEEYSDFESIADIIDRILQHLSAALPRR